MKRTLSNSESLFARAQEIIPWGTQTNAKRPDPALAGHMPYFIDRAEGCRVRDVDGNWYIDFRSSLGPIILGYCHPEVDDAVREQMQRGVLFSMASPLEVELAERFLSLVPGMEQVRFLKTGNDANLASIRLARSHTGRDEIATCGYHGFGDWFACGNGSAPLWFTREKNGVPAQLDAFVNRLTYGDIDEARRLFDERGDRLAAVITVPYDWNEKVGREFLQVLRELCDRHGTVLIFDQVLTGFRLAKGGAQEYFHVIPDLSTYAKAIANGYPLAAFGGKRSVMSALQHVTITSTYAGETLSLAAAHTTLGIIDREPVISHIHEMGRMLQNGFDRMAEEKGLPYRAFGLPPAVQFRFSNEDAVDQTLRNSFFAGLFDRGIFPARPFLLNFAHTADHIETTLAAMAEVLDEMQQVEDAVR